VFSIEFKVADISTPLAGGGQSSTGHTWFVLRDSVAGTALSYGFAPAVHGAAFGPSKVYDDDDSNYLQTLSTRLLTLSEAQYLQINLSETNVSNEIRLAVTTDSRIAVLTSYG